MSEFLKFENLNFSNDLKLRNFQHESCRSWEVMKLCSLQICLFEIILSMKLKFEYLKFEIQI
jgi:hypothetical protein